ncbi:Cell envelope-related transcriptional attenuator [Carbonactinospora thermoautotrophica]|uniref:Cell envelope-related transcriptional attenuator n=2 Tax=Carbonactinospora thermoautotrophica TaxID=1469144 RepID=A0A132MX27_9ACTN|nr:LCP family protein [Carbonactinospora thermoautotrophica]KWX02374.1 Cell envelope-related transcriptional attenuator [Carbonactinospora thermoautotrophica]
MNDVTEDLADQFRQVEAPRARKRLRRALRFTALGVSLALTGCGVAAWAMYEKLSNNIQSEDVGQALGDDRPAVPQANAAGERPLNILVIGSDSRAGTNKRLGGGREDGERSDTTILLHIAADRKSAVALSFPRDILVDIPSCKRPDGTKTWPERKQMFNRAFTYGGSACTIKTVEQLTDVRIDHHVVVDFQGFVNVVDALGGVPIYLPRAVDDKTGNIRLPAGCHLVKGKEALDYVRLRHDESIGGNGGDLGRIQRQQAFLSAMVQRVKSTGVLLNPTRLYAVLDAATKSLKTDPGLSSLGDLMALATSLRDLDTRDIKFVTLPNRPWPHDPNRLEVRNPEAEAVFAALRADQPLPDGRPRTITAAVDRTPAPALPKVRVRVLNGADVPGEAKRVAARLRDAGYTVVAVDNAARQYAHTQITYDPAQARAARALARAVPDARLVARPSGSPVVTLVIGTDFTGVSADAVAPKASAVAQLPNPAPSIEARAADQAVCPAS